MRQTIHLAPAAGQFPSGSILDNDTPEFSNRTICTDAVYVVFTGFEETIGALRVASDFARPIGIPVILIHFRTVAYPLPLDKPAGISPVETEAFVERLRDEGLDPEVRVYLCRDERPAIGSALKAHSLVVVGSGRRWWQRSAARWRHMLEAAGHFVVVADRQPESSAVCASEARESSSTALRAIKKEQSHA